MIELGDLNRLARELKDVENDGLSPKKWCKKNNLDFDSVILLLSKGLDAIEETGDLEEDQQNRVAEVLGQIFKIGWEACREYGRETSDVRGM